MNKQLKYLFCLILFLLQSDLWSQNLYGFTGIINTPDAYTVESGKMVVCSHLYNDYYRTSDPVGILAWAQTINLGLFTWMELSVRLMDYPRLKGNNFDRNLSMKVILLKERRCFPQVSFGLQDVAGTRIYNSTFLVVSKTICPANGFYLVPGFGYGSDVSKYIFVDDPNDYRLQGFFGNLELTFRHRISALMEYENETFNFGLRASPFKFLMVSGYYNDFSRWGGMLGLQFML